MNNLGKWTVIDIETTGIDPAQDDIIDIGFLEFDGLKLVRKYQSLVYSDIKISRFIQKLTGIKQEQVNRAPKWQKVEEELLTLEGQRLIAHNANFEKSFLQKSFAQLGDERETESFVDTMLFFPLLFPQSESLSLERFLIDLGIAESEVHRGFEDSVDLLKVLLFSCGLLNQDLEYKEFLIYQLEDMSEEEFWLKNFLLLTTEELLEIAKQIDFDLIDYLEKYQDLKKKNHKDELSQSEVNFEFSGPNIQKIFRDESNIQKRVPYYTYRSSQEALALRLGQAFKNNIHALVQAPTGTGKTLGYLLPSIIFSKATKQRVLVSTGTKALQDQAMLKDFPDAMNILGLDESVLKVVRLVGSKNHACELYFRKEEDDSNMDLLKSFESKYIRKYLELIFFYNSRVKDYKESITLNSVPYVLKKVLDGFKEKLDDIAVEYKACIGGKCPFKGTCTYFQGLQLAKEADLILGNHALLLTWPRGVEKPAHIVIDEAHKLEQEATQAFSGQLTQVEIESLSKNLGSMIAPLYYLLQSEEKDNLVEDIRAEVPRLMALLSDNINSLKELIERYAKRAPRYTDIYWNEYPMLQKAFVSDELEQSIFNHLESLRFLLSEIFKMVAPFIGKWSSTEVEDESFKTALSLFESFATHMDEALSIVNEMFETETEMANSIRFHEDQGFILSSAPINPGKMFYEQVLSQAQSVVFTSATLANETGTNGMEQVKWMTGYNLLPGERRFKGGLFLKNNFDYKNNAKVFLCSDVPSIYSNDYVQTVLQNINPIIDEIGGKTLLLFSSRQRFEIACEVILSRFEGELEIFIQGLGKNVVEEFKKSSHGILIGMESFGEGIDIPGQSLEFVYVDKIPDLRQDFVIQKRRDFFQQRFGNEFSQYFMATRARLLHQKLGRLLRRETDRGCVIITDPRTAKWKGRTINEFQDMMAPYDINLTSITKACDEAKNFLS